MRERGQPLSGTILAGRYQLREIIGRGGMAAVYRAYQSALDRFVAIKVIAPWLADDPAFVERFRREARVVARLRHPHILTIHDFGEEDGLLYLVTELIEDGTLHDQTASTIPPSAALALLAQIGSALDYAHAQGIVHRDVKPQNIFVRHEPGGDRAILADFGIAKAVAERSEQGLTATGAGIGTPDYMAPEQLTGQPIDGRADLYALATMAYGMLVGRLPFVRDSASDTPMALALRKMHHSPPPPSTVNSAIHPALDQVFARALALDPTERYPTAAALIAALRAQPTMAAAPMLTAPQTALPIPLARVDPHTAPTTPLMREAERSASAKSGRRLLGLAGVLVLLFTLALSGRTLATRQSATPMTVGALIAPTPTPTPPVAARPTAVSILVATSPTTSAAAMTIPTTTMNPPTATLPATATPVPPTAIALAPTMTEIAAATAIPTSSPAPIATATPTRPPTATTTATATAPPSSLGWANIATLNGHTGYVVSVAWAPDGKTLASASYDNTIRLWGADGRAIATLTGHKDAVLDVAWSPDSTTVASAAADNTVRLWSATGKPLATLEGHRNSVFSVAWSPDGQTIATGSGKISNLDADLFEIRLWSATGKPIKVIAAHTDSIMGIAWTPDSKRFATASADQTVKIWSATGQALTTLSGHTDRVVGIAWSPDGQKLATSSGDRTIRIWAGEGKLLTTLSGHSDLIAAVTWSPDSTMLASASYDRSIIIWSGDGKRLATLTGHTDRIRSISWAADGRTLASGSWDGTVRLWR